MYVDLHFCMSIYLCVLKDMHMQKSAPTSTSDLTMHVLWSPFGYSNMCCYRQDRETNREQYERVDRTASEQPCLLMCADSCDTSSTHASPPHIRSGKSSHVISAHATSLHPETSKPLTIRAECDLRPQISVALCPRLSGVGPSCFGKIHHVHACYPRAQRGVYCRVTSCL